MCYNLFMMDKLKEIFKRYNVDIAYLFGSQKDKGFEFLEGKKVDIDLNSDLDIGVHVKEMPDKILDFYGGLYYELSSIFEPFKIDLVILNEVDYIMKYEIINGYRIYAENEEMADEYEELVMKFAEDVYFKYKLSEKDFFEALRDGYFQVKYSKNSK